jgi:hypothetical protein
MSCVTLPKWHGRGHQLDSDQVHRFRLRHRLKFETSPNGSKKSCRTNTTACCPNERKNHVGVRTQRLFAHDRRNLEEKWHQQIKDRRNSRSKMAGATKGRGLQRRQGTVLTGGEHKITAAYKVQNGTKTANSGTAFDETTQFYQHVRETAKTFRSLHPPQPVAAGSPPAPVDTSSLVPYKAPLMLVAYVSHWHKICRALHQLSTVYLIVRVSDQILDFALGADGVTLALSAALFALRDSA